MKEKFPEFDLFVINNSQNFFKLLKDPTFMKDWSSFKKEGLSRMIN